MPKLCADCPHAKKPRSVEQHRRFWAVMAAAYAHWPETHDEQFVSVNHLRKWLQCKAGHYVVQRIYPPNDIGDLDLFRMTLQAAMDAAGAYAFARADQNSVLIYTPLSINFDALSHKKFCVLNTAIDEILRAEIGLSGDELLEAQRAAA